MLDTLKEAAEKAQIALTAAEIVLLEARAAAETLREEAARLVAAVAALQGISTDAVAELSCKSPTATIVTFKGPMDNLTAIEQTPEEFEKERKRKARAREKKEQENNPLAHIKCGGCGKAGKLVDTMITAPSGTPVRMLVCGGCGNQILQ